MSARGISTDTCESANLVLDLESTVDSTYQSLFIGDFKKKSSLTDRRE